MKKALFVPMLTAALGLTTLYGCSDDDTTPVGKSSTQTGNVMAVHASPDAPGVDLLVDNTVAGTNLMFPANTQYLAVPAGTRNVKVNVTSTSVSVFDLTLPISADVNYSVFAVGALTAIDTLILVDNLAAPAAGKAHVRFIHLSPDAPAVDVALQGGAVVFGNKAFKQSTAFTPLDAGTYNLEVRLANSPTVVLPLPNITLQAGKIYTVFAKGFVGGAGNQALGAQIILNN
jgi:hypothetical protein